MPNLDLSHCKVKKCQKFDTPYGDLMDFSYKRTKIESDD